MYERNEIMSNFKDKTLMITGGTGSFGNTVLKHFLHTDVKQIRIFSRDEKKQDDMRHELQAKYPDVANKVKFYIGDVRERQSVRDAMNGVDFMFHAAALKQVPSCEFFPMEAVRTNIIGTDNVLHAAVEAGVKKVVCLSTDKAAYPINAMGISKAMMEHIVTANARVARDAWVVCEKKQRYLKYLYLGSAVLNVVLNYLLIPVWGTAGAAAASLFTQISTILIFPLFIKDFHPNVKLMVDAILLRGVLPKK